MKKVFALSIIVILIIAGCDSEPDVVTTEEGLRYMEDTVGTGESAELGDFVNIHFKAWIINDSLDKGNLFEDWTDDSTKANQMIGNSKQFGQPVKFLLTDSSFIKGSGIGIAGMKEGGTRTMVIPSELAYGEKGVGPVPPNTDIKVKVELMEAREPVVAEMWDVDETKAKETDSGLKYVVIEEGEGETPDSGDVITVHYTGWLKDGSKFDSSVERDEPFKYVYKEQPVIKGWEEGIGMMKTGAKYRLIIPPALGYGDTPMGNIPPNSTLIFDIELLDIKNNKTEN